MRAWLATGNYVWHHDQLSLNTLEASIRLIGNRSHTFSSNLENNCIHNFLKVILGFASYKFFKLLSTIISQIGLDCV
jgi:hypothetical protein